MVAIRQSSKCFMAVKRLPAEGGLIASACLGVMATQTKGGGGLDLGLIGSGLQIAGSIGRMLGLGRKKKSAAQKASEKLSLAQLKQSQALLPGQTSLMQKIQSDALTYDPDRENAAMRAELEASANRTADIGQRSIMGQVARGGGVMGGDTNILRLRQRSLDQAGSPVLMELARLRAGQSATKQALMLNAARMDSGAGGFANQVTYNGMNRPAQDQSGNFAGLTEGVDGFVNALKANQRNSKIKKGAQIASTLGAWLR